MNLLHQAKMQILEYKYTHTNTDGVTGYFTCVPAFSAPWPECLTMLEQRPLDQWLWEHALRQFAALDAEKKRNFIKLYKDECLGDPGNLPDCMNKAILKEFLAQCKLRGLNLDVSSSTDPGKKQILKLCQAANNSIQRHILEELDWTCLELPIKKPEKRPKPLGTVHTAGLMQWKNAQENTNLKELAATVLERLSSANLLEGGEMRHEASLSPIALLRQWRIKSSMLAGDCPWKLSGIGTAYGRGLSLAQARVSCLMEIVERASAHASISENYTFIFQPQLGDLRKSVPEISEWQLANSGKKASRQLLQYCVPAQSASGKEHLVPARDVFLFLNLPGESPIEQIGSTGLAAGTTMAAARLSALVEVMERHAHATMPHDPARCFTPASHDELLQELFNDYRSRGIHVLFEDITCENGLPAYRCFVKARDGRIAQATAAGLNGRDAVLSALGETPWPYAYSRPPHPAEISPKPAYFPPVRFLEDLPDYSTGHTEKDLALLEQTFTDTEPVYVNLTRIDLGYPVVRCIVRNYEINSDFDLLNPPSPTLLARMREMSLNCHTW